MTAKEMRDLLDKARENASAWPGTAIHDLCRVVEGLLPEERPSREPLEDRWFREGSRKERAAVVAYLNRIINGPPLTTTPLGIVTLIYNDIRQGKHREPR